MKKKTLIAWDEKFSIGVPIIDSEHKKLISLCNNLHTVVCDMHATTDEQRKEALSIALKECVKYSQYHFAHEEELMQLCNFDPQKFAEHKKEHSVFIAKVTSHLINFEGENFSSTNNFVKFLYEWILTHIGHVDRLYVNDLKNYLKLQSKL